MYRRALLLACLLLFVGSSAALPLSGRPGVAADPPGAGVTDEFPVGPGTDGWTITGNPLPVGAFHKSGSTDLLVLLTGENTEAWFRAPERYHGDKSSLYGFSLKFVITALVDARLVALPSEQVIIKGAGRTIAYSISSLPAHPTEFRFKTFVVPLVGCAGWRDAVTLEPVSEADMLLILGSVTDLLIPGVYYDRPAAAPAIQGGNDPIPREHTVLLDKVIFGSGETGKLKVSRTRLKFGTVKRGKVKSKNLKITNIGVAPLCVRIRPPLAPFDALTADTEVLLNPGESFTEAVSFIPTSRGLVFTNLEIETSDPDLRLAEIELSGKGR